MLQNLFSLLSLLKEPEVLGALLALMAGFMGILKGVAMVLETIGNMGKNAEDDNDRWDKAARRMRKFSAGLGKFMTKLTPFQGKKK